ncbi:MAG TPA: hypothetical protein VKI61_03600, partial [Chitinophagaceae bacterium]|jgi:hypothetical protein|nr:hypothetical protein [Chitinophagaceae bacterium]
MDCLEYNPKVSETFEKVRRFSFEEKKEALYDEAKINDLLDKILEFKRVFAEKTDRLNTLIEDIEGITWYTNVNNDTLMKINDLISSIKDLHSSLQRQYVSLNPLRAKGIAIPEIKNFKAAMDDLKDVARDLESTFFFLPNLPDFKETTKELSLL